MNLDIDSGGALATAALAAHVIDGDAAHAGKAGHGDCANCGAHLTGPFCHSCGQRDHVHRSLLHLGEEFLHGLLHFDTKSWRTLPLLVIQPGRLTRNYIDGKRARYVSPLALFLFMVFLMFFSVSSLSHMGHSGDHKAKEVGGSIARDIARAKSALAGAEQGLAAAKASGHGVEAAQEAVDAARESVEDAEAAQAMGAGLRGDEGFDKVVEKIKTKNKDSSVNTGFPSADTAIRFAMANPQFTLYKLKNAASKFSFLLVPISLPFLWLMFFWKRGVTMFDHAVFTLYGLSFMALLVVIAALTSAVGLSSVALSLMFFIPPIHMFMQLRGTYHLRVFSALWRTVALLFVSSIVMVLYLLLILMVSMAT
jgi:hypothetical protein